MKEVADMVRQVAPTRASVLLLGESGTGKELMARAIHQLSPRASQPLVSVHCAALSPTLLESELFGHEKGAYTGADKRKNGKFEMAQGGTLFLDEVANLPLGSQAKLLRVLQEKTIYRVGGTQPIGADVRVLAACNKDLHHLGESGSFRSDVYFRLNEFSIWVPPLRERREDILYLAKRFVDVTNIELQKDVKGFTQAAVDTLLTYDWPGNVRQLRSMIRRGVLLADDLITDQHLGIHWASPQAAVACPEGDKQTQDPHQGDLTFKEIMHRKIVATEMEILARVLRETGGNKAKAARLLHIDYKTIHSKVRQYGISVD
jgi:two-component system nitrogen regulation response regulator GlnG